MSWNYQLLVLRTTNLGGSMKKLVRFLAICVFMVSFVIGICIYPNRYIKMDAYYQYPDMPNGCEVTAMSILSNYYDAGASKYNIESYLRKSGFSNADPNKAYIGSPYSRSGFYCYAPPVVDAANSYFTSKGLNINAVDKTGMSIFGVLNNIIFSKRPVMVWFTVDYKDPEMSGRYYTDENGEKNELYKNLHSVVV